MLTTKYDTKMRGELPHGRITKDFAKDIKILKPIYDYNVGDLCRVIVDSKGIPKNELWRRRFRDHLIDHCIEITSEHNDVEEIIDLMDQIEVMPECSEEVKKEIKLGVEKKE